MASCYDDCVKWYNRYIYGEQLSPEEQACCAAIAREDIQTVVERTKQYYPNNTDAILAAQKEADRQKAQTQADVEAINKSICPFPVGTKCYQNLGDLFADYGKYLAYGAIAVVVFYVFLLVQPFLPKRS